MNLVKWLDKRQHWWKIFVIIFAVSISVVGYIGVQTYRYAPPVANFHDESGAELFSSQSIQRGQQVFLQRGLMEYGSFLGDGAMRGPDFSAEALHLTAVWMNEEMNSEWLDRVPDDNDRAGVVEGVVQRELKRNRYDADSNTVTVCAAQAVAFHKLVQYNTERFGEGGSLVGSEAFHPANYITDKETIADLSAFFYWGAWICSSERPGYEYSFTHNWPFDPLAGNTPTSGILFWSVIGGLALVLATGIVFYFYGKMDREAVLEAQQSKLPPLASDDLVENSRPTPTQRACYKFMAVAAALFLVQICAGLLAIDDFVGVLRSIGLDVSAYLPVTLTRAWHSQISVLWISVCWFAATIWVLPLICRPEPSGQLKWINTLFWLLIIVAGGTFLGLFLGINRMLGDLSRWFGIQGWEFMTMGRAYQYVLFLSFCVWFVIVLRGLWPVLRERRTWSLPNWMAYSIAGIIFMFTASFVANPDTNFVIADFWRWCTIHMWVEAFFELFTTVILAYFLYLMGFVSHMVAARIVYLAAVLFLGSGLIGISHNFYWNAKSIETVALGGVLSTLQIVPLILLTVEAWRFRHMPGSTIDRLEKKNGTRATFGLSDAFLFLIGVNFWNFMGAGVLGFTINLPIVNYYQHGTYLTVNHGHAALFGVYGNLAIATMLFCGRWIIQPSRWNHKLLKSSFWWLNIGLILMVLLDLFPVGIHQLMTVLDSGYAYARSAEYIHGSTFQAFTWLRGIGIAAFVCGGVLPLTWFMLSRWRSLKPVQTSEESYIVPPTVLASPENNQSNKD